MSKAVKTHFFLIFGGKGPSYRFRNLRFVFSKNFEGNWKLNVQFLLLIYPGYPLLLLLSFCFSFAHFRLSSLSLSPFWPFFEKTEFPQKFQVQFNCHYLDTPLRMQRATPRTQEQVGPGETSWRFRRLRLPYQSYHATKAPLFHLTGKILKEMGQKNSATQSLPLNVSWQ